MSNKDLMLRVQRVAEAASLRMRVFLACYPTHELRIVDNKGNSQPFKQRAVNTQEAA